MSDPLIDAANAISTVSPNTRAFAQLAAQRIIALEGKLPPPPVVVSQLVAPPRAPISDISNLTGLGLNIYTGPETHTDLISSGTFDTTVLVQPKGKGSVIQRVHLDHCASLGAGPGYGRHGFYLKAENVTVEDAWVRCDPSAKDVGSCFSVRDAGAVIRRFDAAGLFVASVYEDSTTVGQILFEDGVGVSTYPDTGVWVDTTRAHEITFRRCHFNGPGLFMRVSAAFPGTVISDHCTWNGHSVTATDTNVATGKLTIL